MNSRTVTYEATGSGPLTAADIRAFVGTEPDAAVPEDATITVRQWEDQRDTGWSMTATVRA